MTEQLTLHATVLIHLPSLVVGVGLGAILTGLVQALMALRMLRAAERKIL